MIVSPKLGWRMSSSATIPVSAAVSGTTGSERSFSFSDSSQAMVTMNRGFRNSDGWNWAKPAPIQRRAPFTSVPMIGTRNRSAGEDRRAEQAQPPRPRLGQHRDDDHHRNGDRDPHQLAVEIIKRLHARALARQALAGGGRGGGDRDQPDRDQHRDQDDEDLVDLPEPFGDRARVRAAVAGRLRSALGLHLHPRRQAHGSAPTIARKASPRAS